MYACMYNFNMSCKIIVRKSCKTKSHIRLYYFFCLEDIDINIFYISIYYIYYINITYIYMYICNKCKSNVDLN